MDLPVEYRLRNWRRALNEIFSHRRGCFRDDLEFGCLRDELLYQTRDAAHSAVIASAASGGFRIDIAASDSRIDHFV